MLEERLRLRAVVGEDDDSHAEVKVHVLRTHTKWLLQETEDALAGSDGLSSTRSQRKHDAELVCRESSHGVGRSTRLPQSSAQLTQDRVAGLVAERVVDRSEIVEVRVEQREGLVG